jgi:hypothetical protein
MGYKRRYSKRGRSRSGFGSAVSDSTEIASKLGLKGALITGTLGFVFFYYVIPWALAAWVEHNKAKLSGQNAAIFGKLLDEVFLRRFVHPSEWAGIAILISCIALAFWKAFARKELGRTSQRELTGISKLLARILD